MTIKQSKYEQFMSSYEGKELLKKHTLTEIGIWKVRGADSNCDFGGHHYMPELGQFEGSLQDIVMYAIELSSFWSWGPGDITKVGKPIKIDSVSTRRIVELRASKAKLEAELKAVNLQLKGA